jgi:hypothetical protein
MKPAAALRVSARTLVELTAAPANALKIMLMGKFNTVLLGQSIAIRVVGRVMPQHNTTSTYFAGHFVVNGNK